MIYLSEYPEMKEWIEDHIDLIEQEKFEEIYNYSSNVLDIPVLTQILLQAGIDPLEKLNYVPAYYLTRSDISSFKVPSHVTKIESCAFADCEILQTVILHDDIRMIDFDAFSDCHNLTNVTLPKNLELLKSDAFAATGIREIIIPDFVTNIPMNCFEECNMLEKVKFGQSVRRVGKCAFGACENLKEVLLNDELQKISDYVFKECHSLKEIYIPDSVTNISTSAFYNCSPTIICSKDSTAHKYAEEHNFRCKLI